MKTPRIALIHATPVAIDPICNTFKRLWPQAQVSNLLDDSLSRDLAAAGRLEQKMINRFCTLARYTEDNGADAILFTCSAFGPCIEACAAALAPMPVLKPNEAMIEEALLLVGSHGRVGLMASFAPTLASMPAEFAVAAPGLTLVPCLATGALAALDRGEGAEHDRLAAIAAAGLADCDVIALSQFSLARAAGAVAAVTGKKVLSTPDSAVRKLRRLLGA